MTLSSKISQIMTFKLPLDWEQRVDEGEASALEELTAGLTEEGRLAIAPYLDSTAQSPVGPDSYSASANWSTDSNFASIAIYADVVGYQSSELEQTDNLLRGRTVLTVDDVTDSAKGCPLFSTWYWPHSGKPQDTSPIVHVGKQADPALLEAFYEMKAKASFADDFQPNNDPKVTSAHVGMLKSKPAIIVNSIQWDILMKQTGYHLLLAREPYHKAWHALELHLFLYCTATNSAYVEKDFSDFLSSIDWLPLS